VQKLFTQQGVLRSLIDMIPLLTAGRVLSAASTQPSLSFVTEQVLLAASTLVWCSPPSQMMLHETGTLEALLRAMNGAYARLSTPAPPAGGIAVSPQHDTVVYQSSLLLLLNAQLENKQMQDIVAQLVATSAKPKGEASVELCGLYSLYHRLFDAFEHIRLNHHHSDEVVKALRIIARGLCASDEAPYLLVHMRGTQTLEALLRCLSNIDEEVLLAGCCALYALIQRSPPARLLFLRKNGIAELSECLRDYNTAIKGTALQIVCALAAEIAPAREQMRQEELLLCVLRTIQSFPAEDVTLGVLDAALEAVAHMVMSCPPNQEYIRLQGGIEPLVDALQYTTDHISDASPAAAPADDDMWSDADRPAVDLFKVTETACFALGNVVYHCAENQAAAVELGVLPVCLALLERQPGEETPPSVQASALNLLINLADINPVVQDALGTERAAACIQPLLSAPDSPRVVCAACLLLSHVAWNHTHNQLLFGTEAVVRQLLSILTPAGRAEVMGSHWSGSGSEPPASSPSPSAEIANEEGGVGVELALYAMMALVNLSYCRSEVQDMVRACGGVPLLHLQLSSPIFQLRRTAAFCLGNLVRDNSENASEVVAHGGVELLLRCLTDQEEDELSKTAYSTIAHLGEAGLHQLLHQAQEAALTLEQVHSSGFIATSSKRADSADGPPHSPVAMGGLRDALNEICEEEVDDFDVEERELQATHTSRIASPSHSAHLSAEAQAEAAVEQLLLLVPVLNGLVYTHDVHRAACLRDGTPLLFSLLRAVPLEVQQQLLHLLHNTFFGAGQADKLRAAELGGVEAVLHVAAAAHSLEEPEALAMAMSVLCSLTNGAPENCALFASDHDGLALAMTLCEGPPSDAKASACELFVGLCEAESARADLLRSGGRRILEAIGSSADCAEAVAARAKVLLREIDQRR